MKYLLSYSFVLILTVTNAIGQTKSQSKTQIPIKNQISDSTKGGDTLLIMKYSDALQLLKWVDATNEPNQSVKNCEKFIQSHIVVYPADKVKQK